MIEIVQFDSQREREEMTLLASQKIFGESDKRELPIFCH